MPRNWSKAVPENNGPIPHQDEFESREPTMADFYRMVKELFDKSDRKLDELTEEMRGTKQRLASLEQDAQQPRLPIEADVKSDTKTRNRSMENTVADQAKHEVSCSASQVDPDQMCLTSFGDDSTGPPALPCSRNATLIDKGAAAPKPCLSPMEMRTLTVTCGLLSAGTASTATMTIFHQPPLWFCLTDEISSRTSTQYAT